MGWHILLPKEVTKMKLLQINTCNFGSTGKIMRSIELKARESGYDVASAYAKSRSNLKGKKQGDILIGSILSRNLHLLLAKVTGLNGCFSFFSTLNFLQRVKRLSPDVIHLHNLHNCYINLPLLFGFIKKHNIRVVWTLHDCWAFTGHCPYFTLAKCDKWKSGCHTCPNYKEYPASLFDNSKFMYRLKKKWFTGVNDLTIITPSQWLGDLVKQSFLDEYSVQVINNGIDLSVFKPTESNFRKKHHCEDKFVLLGVALPWSKRKGMGVFVELSKRLDDRFQIVLVGTNESIDKQLPDNIISIHRTHNQAELAEIYTAADLFVNPTMEENYPTVNMEAIACGTPVLTFNTGGSGEIPDNTCGVVVSENTVDDVLSNIIKIFNNNPFSKADCLKRAQSFAAEEKYAEYIELYRKILC